MQTTFNLPTALQYLQHHFGYESFRDGQAEIMAAIVEGRDTLVIMPTGGGKSLCYQIPALIMQGTALIISPLIALMKDQVDALGRARVSATFINSSLPYREIQRRMQEARQGRYAMIYLAPERLESERFLDELRQVALSFIAVDEAHCVSEWGHDFRPSYTAIHRANEALGNLPVIALTATATEEVREDIITQLRLRKPRCFIRGFDRPNLHFSVEAGTDKISRMVEVCSVSQGTNIIYCGSRKKVEEVCAALRNHKLAVVPYHAGMPDHRRKTIQEHFLDGKADTIVATNAFGMGVDKADVRNVIHHDIPLTLEAYYQEAGRAGRDGGLSDCILLYDRKDRSLPEFFIRCTYPETDTLQKVYTFLYDAHATPIGQRCIVPILLDNAQIGNRLGLNSFAVSSAISFFQREGILQRGAIQGTARLQFTTSRERIREYFRNTRDQTRKNVLVALMRSLGAESLQRMIEFDVQEILYKQELKPADFENTIRALEYARILKYEAPGTQGGITLIGERRLFSRLGLDLEALAERRERAFKKLNTVIRYAESTDCKRNYLLGYFGQRPPTERCGACSTCRKPVREQRMRSARRDYLLQKVLTAAVELDGRFGRNVLADVVKGHRGDKIVNFSLHQAPSFGSGSEFSRAEIMQEVDSAISERYLVLSAEIHPTVRVTARGLAVPGVDTRPLTIRRYPKVISSHPRLLKRLQRVRIELARREGIPANAIVDDKTLGAIADTLATNTQEMEQISGIGPIFLNRFAPEFVRVVREYTAREQEEHTAPAQTESALPTRLKALVDIAGAEGLDLFGLAAHCGMSASTTARKLQEALELGAQLGRRQFVDDALYEPVLDYLKANRYAALRDVRTQVSAGADFAQLRVAVAFARQELGYGSPH